MKAVVIVHWPSGPVGCCQEHAEDLLALANFLGSHVGVTKALDGVECSNCKNESLVP